MLLAADAVGDKAEMREDGALGTASGARGVEDAEGIILSHGRAARGVCQRFGRGGGPKGGFIGIAQPETQLAMAGAGGVLLAHFDGYLNPKSFEFIKSFEILIMIILGGLGSIVGSVLGAILLTVLPEALRGFAEYRMVIYSLLLIILMITRPQGLLGSSDVFKGFRRRLRRLTEGPGGTASSPTQSETSVGGENPR